MGNDPRTWAPQPARPHERARVEAETELRAALADPELGAELDVEREIGRHRAAQLGFDRKVTETERLAAALQQQGFPDPWESAKWLIAYDRHNKASE